MEIKVPYLKDIITVKVPDHQVIAVKEPNDKKAPKPAEELITEALKSQKKPQKTSSVPQAQAGQAGPQVTQVANDYKDIQVAADPRDISQVPQVSFEEFLQAAKNLLIIVNDQTRPTPTRNVLQVIDPILENNLPIAGISFIVATGVHRGPSEEEYRAIFGDDLYEKYKPKIFAHDARKDEMVYLGTSRAGTEMYVNKRGVEADRILVIGSVEPHYFAGYTGGRKGFLPGIASYKTIEQNHKHALHPEAKALNLTGNPVHEDMVDALKVVKKEIFSIMTVLDKYHNIYAVTAGDINSSFYAAIQHANDIFVADIPRKADVVVTVAKYPMDIDLYQSQKAIDNAKLALKEGGTMILVSSCRDGVGEEAFVKLLSSSQTPEGVLDKIKGEYKLGYHKAGKMAEVFLKAKVHALTGLSSELLESIFIVPEINLQQAIENALQKQSRIKGSEAEILFLLDGSVTVPRALQE